MENIAKTSVIKNLFNMVQPFEGLNTIIILDSTIIDI
jgi:hypothetical protein